MISKKFLEFNNLTWNIWSATCTERRDSNNVKNWFVVNKNFMLQRTLNELKIKNMFIISAEIFYLQNRLDTRLEFSLPLLCLKHKVAIAKGFLEVVEDWCRHKFLCIHWEGVQKSQLSAAKKLSREWSCLSRKNSSK